MNFILYVKCTEQEDFTYSNPFYELLKNEITTADFLDLDNFSENELIEHCCKAIELSEKSCILLKLEPEANTKGFMKLVTYIADRPEKCRIFITGKDNLVSRLLFPQENFSFHNLSEEEELHAIRTFLA